MAWKRHVKAELYMSSKGMDFACYARHDRSGPYFGGVINFVMNYDRLNQYWTCSFRTHGGDAKTTHIKVGAQPLLTSTGTVYTFPTQMAAEEAVRITLASLRNGKHPDDVTS